EFYRIEGEIRGMGPGQRLSARQARTAPIMAEFGEWLQNQRRRISSKSRLGEKLTYIHRQWSGLQTFLHDGRVEIDSNAVENLIRPIALTRKNALFARHDEGGHAWGRIASLSSRPRRSMMSNRSHTSKRPLKRLQQAIRPIASTTYFRGISSRQANTKCWAGTAY
ncbi:hypothetical protein LCGC14_2226890, partial [marine sediment metagenome]